MYRARCDRWQLFLAGFACAFVASPLAAALPTDPSAKAQLIGQPLSLLVQPETITLTGPRDRQQIIVTGRYGDGSVRDLTPFCDLDFETAEVAQAEDGGFLLP